MPINGVDGLFSELTFTLYSITQTLQHQQVRNTKNISPRCAERGLQAYFPHISPKISLPPTRAHGWSPALPSKAGRPRTVPAAGSVLESPVGGGDATRSAP